MSWLQCWTQENCITLALERQKATKLDNETVVALILNLRVTHCLSDFTNYRNEERAKGERRVNSTREITGMRRVNTTRETTISDMWCVLNPPWQPSSWQRDREASALRTPCGTTVGETIHSRDEYKTHTRERERDTMERDRERKARDIHSQRDSHPDAMASGSKERHIHLEHTHTERERG